MRNRSLLIPALALTLTLLVTALLVTPAFAQDETPTSEPPPLVEETLSETAPVEIPAAEESVETPLEALAMEDLTLVDGSGEPLVMATQEAAGALAAGDVWFKVGTVTYTFNTTDCDPGPGTTSCAEPIQAAINYIRDYATIPSDGTIHVDAGTNLADQVILIDGSVNASVNKIKALIGGVSTTNFQPNVTLTGISSILIQNMTYGTGFLLSGFNIQSSAQNFGIKVENSTGPLKLIDLAVSGTNGTAIYVGLHNGAIEMDRVNVRNNAHQGAEIQNYDNTTGSYKTGAITIRNSSFDRNGGVYVYGSLAITTGGSVSLQGITVNNNEYGLHINHSGKVTVKDSIFNNNTIAGTYAFWLEDITGDPLLGDILLDNVVVKDNDYGIKIHTYGNITANRLVVNDNAHIGAWFNTCGSGGDCYPYYYGKVTVTNSNFDDNGGPEMLRIWSRGAVALTNVSASRNTAGAGALVHTHNSLLVAPVTITGGTFNDNSTYGLEVLSKGTITLSKVKASGNTGSYGATLDNSSGTAAGVIVKGTLVGDNAFDDNGGEGLFIRSNGAVTLGYLSASGNANRGLEVNNTGGTGKVTISKATLDGNVLNGVMVRSKGAIALTTVSASSNIGQGANLINDSGTGGVTITGGAFNHNQGTGLYVRSNGAITLKTTQASDNSAHNMAFPVATAQTVHDTLGLEGNIDRWTVSVNNGDSATFTLRTREWEMLIELFDPDGNSHGVYPVDYDFVNNDYFVDVNASFDQDGIWSVAISNPEQFYYSGEYRLSYSLGTGVDAYYDFAGADLDNKGGTAGVTIANAAFPLEVSASLVGITDVTLRDFNSNSGTGLMIRTNGAISLTNLKALNNGSKGVDLNNVPLTGTAAPAVTITKGQYDINGNTGLDVASRGVITLKDVQASSNRATFQGGADGYGIRLVNSGPGKAVSIINPVGSFGGIQSNAKDGLVITSQGAITLTNISPTYNQGHGLLVDNTSGAGNLTLTNAYAYDNTEDGIHATIKGAITLKSVDVWGNDGWGAYLHNDQVTTGAPAVTITNTLMYGMAYQGFGINTLGGLDILTRGPVTLTNVNVYDNTGPGAVIANNAAGSYDVKINNCYFDVRYEEIVSTGIGLQVTSLGNIILNKGSASGNELDGAVLNNAPAGPNPVKAVTITGFAFDGNGGSGLTVTSNGVVTLTNVSASNNDNDGAFINNGKSAVNVKASGSGSNFFDGNKAGSGLYLATTGAISLMKVSASGNSENGVYFSNSDGVNATNVTINTGTFNDNDWYGLNINTYGTVLLNSVSADGNGHGGASIVSVNSAAPKSVTVNKSHFNGNTQTGLEVETFGTITLNGVSASENDLYGAYLKNQAGTAGVNILSSMGPNIFNENNYRGLRIETVGNVVLNTVTANGNHSSGISIGNNTGQLAGAVSLTKITTWDNYYYGLLVYANGNVTINTASSAFNGFGNAPANYYSGIHVETNGHNFTVLNSLVTSNAAYGIRGVLGSVSAVFTITNTYYFGNNVSDTGYVNLYITH